MIQKTKAPEPSTVRNPLAFIYVIRDVPQLPETAQVNVAGETSAAAFNIISKAKQRHNWLFAASVLFGSLSLQGCTTYPVAGYPGYYGAYPYNSSYPGYHPAPVAPTYQSPSNNGNNYYPGYYPPAYYQPQSYPNGTPGFQQTLPMSQ